MPANCSVTAPPDASPPPVPATDPPSGADTSFILSGRKQQSPGTEARRYKRQAVPEMMPSHSVVPVQTCLAELPRPRRRARAASQYQCGAVPRVRMTQCYRLTQG
ncbi:hypothetical protein E2C01_010927 [Portunus trituberculatus]|uniref:Uncharacterized protein n=1 Tax=Portunus trituberculatus TaxID=210409 RepID=A0A5B7D9N8_PORTR|nr:hypothetical protein [Portunus trituberculatus]